jgi:hypothetical protein
MSNAYLDVQQYARQLVDSVKLLPDFEIPTEIARYATIGPVLADAVLQAGVNYKNVVAPRINRLIERYAEACEDTYSFLYLLRITTSYELLAWQHYEKPRRLLELTEWLVAREVCNICDLRNWLSCESRAQTLAEIKGIGAKTIDYLKNLVGLPTVAVDRHIRKLVLSAGIPVTDYVEIRSIVSLAADLLAVRPDYLDHAMWLYVSRTANRSA